MEEGGKEMGRENEYMDGLRTAKIHSLYFPIISFCNSKPALKIKSILKRERNEKAFLSLLTFRCLLERSYINASLLILMTNRNDFWRHKTAC